MLISQHLKNDLTTAETGGVFVAALTIPVMAILRQESSWGHALSRIIKSMLPLALFRPVILCLGVALLPLLGMALTVDRVLVISLLACVIAFGIQYLMLKDAFSFSREEAADTSKSAEWLKTGLYLSVTILLIDYFQNVVIVMSALGLNDDDVARLAVALRFSGFLRMGLMAVNMAVSPRISRALNAGEMSKALTLIKQSTHLKFWPTVLVTLGVWGAAPWLVGLFGAEYAAAALPLQVFAVLPLFAAFFGPSIMILNITGRQREVFMVSAISLALLVVAVPVAGWNFGINGASIASAITIFFWEWALYDRTRKGTGIDASILGTLGLRSQGHEDTGPENHRVQQEY